ncbi:MAG: lipopolysaccharide heptosyltransferase II [Gammaproteobacteria bacterium]|nr:lipopolysaccharide heptosyltransferase II [Gammaproteobacteria bacterium]MBT8133137.1 lipopolysaccharide heptosyltransferase II [Gammaproteobacteria bacterium]NNJ49136.1 lipopolysaccharide heptosyltransferase II [Gammaproteobacteria bacterium]
MSQEKRRYLIVGPSWIGDMVMAQSLFITLKKLYPDCLIDVIAPRWSLPILKRMPEVSEGIAVDVGHGEFSFFKRRRMGLGLKSRKYTHAIVIPRSWKSALIPYFAGVPVRTGYSGEMRYGLLNDRRRLDKEVLQQTVQRYVAHAMPDGAQSPPDIPFPKLRIDAEQQAQSLSALGLDLERPVVCMMPGAEYGPAKQWPVEYYKKLAGKLLQDGWQVWVLGSDKDKAAGDMIAADNDVHNLCGRTQLVEAIDLLACARSVVSNDSGLMHVAAAVGVDINVIYGSSTPEYTPPLTSDEHKYIYYLRLDCSPCFERVCPLGHTDCLYKINYEEVYRNIRK